MTTADPFRLRNLSDADVARMDPSDLLEDERRCLGAAIRDNNLMHGVLAGLSPDHFSLAAHKELFAMMRKWSDDQLRFDVDRLNHALRQQKDLQDLGGIAYLQQLLQHGRQSVGNVTGNARLLMRKAVVGPWSLVVGKQEATIASRPSAIGQQGIPTADGRLPLANDQGPTTNGFLMSLTDVEAKPLDWIWEPYLPCGAVAVLSGDPGVGKSFVALAISAAVTRGVVGPWSPRLRSGQAMVVGKQEAAVGQEANRQCLASTEDQRPKSNDGVSPANDQRPTTNDGAFENSSGDSSGVVLYFGTSDSPAQVLRPRFDALGGDASRLRLLQRYPFPVTRSPQNSDTRVLTGAARETGNRERKTGNVVCRETGNGKRET
jgi:hypothetical protein